MVGGQRICEEFAENKMALVGYMTEDIDNMNKHGLIICHSIN
jgi:hypothetical protein